MKDRAINVQSPEVCELLGLKPSTSRRYAAEGKHRFTCFQYREKKGAPWFVMESELAKIGRKR